LFVYYAGDGFWVSPMLGKQVLYNWAYILNHYIIFLFFERRSHYVVQTDLEPLIFLPPPPARSHHA
jgi:hypothetical protein